MIRGAHYEDPPLFSSETEPAFGPGIREGAGPVFELYNTYLGDQWRIGDWEGMLENVGDFLPAHRMITFQEGYSKFKTEPPQNIKEYDPEWGKAFFTGTVGASCDHEQMLAKVKCPVLFTHHFSKIDPETGRHLGASTTYQVDHVEDLIKKTGQPFTRLSFPEMGHNMHLQDPELYARTFTEWAKKLPDEEDK